jgi:hypothetical protein
VRRHWPIAITLAGVGRSASRHFLPIEAHFCENPLLIFTSAVPGRLPANRKTACAALRFGAVDEISFPYRHH